MFHSQSSFSLHFSHLPPEFDLNVLGLPRDHFPDVGPHFLQISFAGFVFYDPYVLYF